MSTTNSSVYQNALATKKYADIEALTSAVSEAQYDVDELTSIVNALTSKQSQYNALLTKAETEKATALSNYDQVKVVANKMATLKHYSQNVNHQMYRGDPKNVTPNVYCKVNNTAQTMSVLIEKLIFSVDVIEKLAGFVNRQKAANPVIPDELITLLTQATTDSNNAVALTLKAMESAYSAVFYVDDVSSVSGLEIQQLTRLDEVLGNEKQDKQTPTAETLFSQIHRMYTAANNNYQYALDASNMATGQLEHAQGQLANATTKLNSLKAGLDAAKAAAFAA